MMRFRLPRSSAPSPFISYGVQAVVAETFRPAHFFLSSQLDLEWEHVEAEELVWEIFRGQLLDPAHTRQRRTFESWKVYAQTPEGERSGEPLLALYLDSGANELHVVRSLDSYAWEGYDSGGNVYRSRETRKWLRERVGTIALDAFGQTAELIDELACQLFLAVVGTSRLPLSSLETPLPAFSFGHLFYCYRPDAPPEARPARDWRAFVADMLIPGLHPREEAHWFETFLHAVPVEEMREASAIFVRRWTECGRTRAELPALLRLLFNEVSLSPYTDLVDKTLAFLRAAVEESLLTIENIVDFLSFLLRHIGRHLTAYDLVIFHHRGANYPDVLLLDAVLVEYRKLLRQRPGVYLDGEGDDAGVRRTKRIRRRALRQGWLLRRRYEGHAVPDLPTSPGENRRVLPSSHPRVSAEQIEQPARRSRFLYEGDRLVLLDDSEREALRQSFVDLDCDEEWREMGLGLFLDRPFGVGKRVGEPDATLLLSAEAFSPSTARQRLHALATEIDVSAHDEFFVRLLARPPLSGVPLESIGEGLRPGIVSLLDARLAAADFVFLRSTPSSIRALFEQFDFTPLAALYRLEDVLNSESLLLARSPTSDGLRVHDRLLRVRMELEIAVENGFSCRGGREFPVLGLRVLSVAETAADGETLAIHNLRDKPVSLPPR